jgi:hypothetical protein
MEDFTPIPALVGGVLIGLAAAILLLLNGRLAGVSGIAGGLTALKKGDTAWRVFFLGGLIVGALAYGFAQPSSTAITISDSLPLLILGGLAVGFGTRMGGGCTSGHGVCGIARVSVRSLAATVTFMVLAVATVFVARHLVGA